MATQASETILIFAANSLDQPALSLDWEVREIQNGLRHSRKHFDVRQQWATRPKDLRRALLDHHPSYVHFCGHGTGAPGIVLEGSLADADALASLFALFAERIKCVVLNACYSSVQAHAIAKHIDYVVGMSKAIEDAAAIEFSTAFYDALGADKSIEFAFGLGCAAIQMAGVPDHLTPQLLVRSPGLPSRANPARASRDQENFDERRVNHTPPKLKIFVSYAHEDEGFKMELEKRLKAISRMYPIETWSDRKILAGELIHDEILRELQSADITLLLISPSFVASDYCWTREMEVALEQYEREGGRMLVPIIVRRTPVWHESKIGRYMALPKDGRPLSAWPDADEFWGEVEEGLRHLIRRRLDKAG